VIAFEGLSTRRTFGRQTVRAAQEGSPRSALNVVSSLAAGLKAALAGGYLASSCGHDSTTRAALWSQALGRTTVAAQGAYDTTRLVTDPISQRSNREWPRLPTTIWSILCRSA
jgi:hypothetical protein